MPHAAGMQYPPPCRDRSRSAPRAPTQHLPRATPPGAGEGFPAMRQDAPGRLAWARGSRPSLATEAERQRALEELERGFYAESSAPAVRARRRCIKALLAPWSMSPYPATADKLRCLAAGLKAGRYRSAASLLSQYKVDAERAGESWSSAMLRLYADVGRSCRRGQGPALQSAALPFEKLHLLPPGPQPWCQGGPLGPRNFIVAGSWWMLREVEAATARAHLARIDRTSVPTASLQLPATKADLEATWGDAHPWVHLRQGPLQGQLPRARGLGSTVGPGRAFWTAVPASGARHDVAAVSHTSGQSGQ